MKMLIDVIIFIFQKFFMINQRDLGHLSQNRGRFKFHIKNNQRKMPVLSLISFFIISTGIQKASENVFCFILFGKNPNTNLQSIQSFSLIIEVTVS